MIKSALLAGFIAGFAWMAITAATDGSNGAIVTGGFIFLIGTAVVTYVIELLVVRSKSV